MAMETPMVTEMQMEMAMQMEMEMEMEMEMGRDQPLPVCSFPDAAAVGRNAQNSICGDGAGQLLKSEIEHRDARQPVVERHPARASVARPVNADVCAGIHVVWIPLIDDNRIHRHIRDAEARRRPLDRGRSVACVEVGRLEDVAAVLNVVAAEGDVGGFRIGGTDDRATDGAPDAVWGLASAMRWW
jgi:hypothetical protein